MTEKKHWLTLGFIFTLFGIGASAYLVSHHYDLIHGMSESKSFCNINSSFDCDAVNSSKYSELFGIPMALFAALTYFIELLLLLGVRAFDGEDKKRMGRYFFDLSLLSTIPTLFLLLVSTFILKTYCLVCISLYVVTGVSLLVGIKLSPPDRFRFLKSDFINLFKSGTQGGARGVLILLLVIPLGSLLIHGMMTQNIKDMGPVIAQSLADWEASPKFEFNTEGAPSIGNPNASFKIVEFFDYQCPHCKRASLFLHSFVGAHPGQVHLTFQNYPLDKSCNSDIKSDMHLYSCNLARAALCANKQGQFLKVHDWIFEHQETLDTSSIDQLITDLKIDGEKLKGCMASPGIREELAGHVERAHGAKIQGTPTVFVNGRLLPLGFLIPVLEEALNRKAPKPL